MLYDFILLLWMKDKERHQTHAVSFRNNSFVLEILAGDGVDRTGSQHVRHTTRGYASRFTSGCCYAWPPSGALVDLHPWLRRQPVDDAVVAGVNEPHAPRDAEHDQGEDDRKPQTNVKHLRVEPAETRRQIQRRQCLQPAYKLLYTVLRIVVTNKLWV